MTTTLQVHVTNIMDVDPGPVQCMSLNETTLKLALFRGGNEPVIELWDVASLPFKETVLTDLEKVDDNVSVETIVWVKDRLFSCGLHGFVVEHDLKSGRIKGKTAATSGPVWCLGVSPNELFLAAGTEDGFVNIFDVVDEGLVYQKVLDRQEGRHLCLSWSPCGKYIATGSVDSLRLWDVEKGHAMQRLLTGRSKNTETIVWCILMLEDFLIVTGDSRGILSLWDGRIGVLKTKLYSHKADILCLKLSSDGGSIYAAGVDPSVVLLSRVGKSGDKWVKSHQRNMHTNDVMCLATHGNRLFSAGIDADLLVSSFPPKTVTKYPPIPSPHRVNVSKSTRHVLIQNGRSLDLWKLPGDNTDLIKLVEFGSRKQDVINSSCLSPTGHFFGYSTDDKINFFRLSTRPGGSGSPLPKLKKLSGSSTNEIDNLLPTVSLQFMNESLVLAISQSALGFIEIDSETEGFSCKKIHSLSDIMDNWSSPEEKMLSLVAAGKSPTNKYLFVALSNFGNSAVTVLKFLSEDLSIVKSRTTPKYRFQPTALSFHPESPYILIAYSDHTVQVFNFSSGKIIYDAKLGKGTTPSVQPVLGAFWSRNGERVVLHDVDKLYLMEIERRGEEEDEGAAVAVRAAKKTKLSSGTSNGVTIQEEIEREKLNFSVQTCDNNYKWLVSVGFLEDETELLAIEIKPSRLLEKLPPAFAKKRFGM